MGIYPYHVYTNDKIDGHTVYFCLVDKQTQIFKGFHKVYIKTTTTKQLHTIISHKKAHLNSTLQHYKIYGKPIILYNLKQTL